jgi:hypothetical protein
MTATKRSNTRITKPDAKQRSSKRLPWYNRISRQSLRIAILESFQLAQQHSLISGGKKDTTESLVRTSNPHDAQSMTARPHLSEELGAANLAQRVTRVEIANCNGIKSSRKGWYYIKHIMAEVGKDDRHMYLVEWEGINPTTGAKWPNSWVGFSNSSYHHDAPTSSTSLITSHPQPIKVFTLLTQY